MSKTDFGYTNQRNYADMGLMDYRARFYSPTLGRFTQPDSVIPDLTNSQAWNRYSYTLNSPIMYVDPSGHAPLCLDGEQCFERTGNDNIHISTSHVFTEAERKPRNPNGRSAQSREGLETAEWALANLDYELLVEIYGTENFCTMYASDAAHADGCGYDWDVDGGWTPTEPSVSSPYTDVDLFTTYWEGVGFQTLEFSNQSGAVLSENDAFLEFLVNNEHLIQPGDMVIFRRLQATDEGPKMVGVHAAVVVGFDYDPDQGIVAPLIIDPNGPLDQQPRFLYSSPSTDIFEVTIIKMGFE